MEFLEKEGVIFLEYVPYNVDSKYFSLFTLKRQGELLSILKEKLPEWNYRYKKELDEINDLDSYAIDDHKIAYSVSWIIFWINLLQEGYYIGYVM